MKLSIGIAVLALAAGSFVLASCNSGTETKSDAKTEMKADTASRPLAAGEKIIYQCPMHPEEMSDKPGACPKCGMDLEKKIVSDTVKTTIQ